MAMLGNGEILVAVLLFVFIHFWRRNRNTPTNLNWPILRMLPSLLHNVSNIHDHATRALKHNGGTLKFEGPWLTNMNFVITSDPLNVNHITSKNIDNYGKGTTFTENFEILGDGIFNSESQTWKHKRATLHSFFKQVSFQSFFYKTVQKKMESSLLPFLDHAFKGGILVDLQDAFQRLTFDNMCSIVLGFDPNSLSINFPEVACEKAFNEIEEAWFYRHVMPRCIWKMQKWLQVGREKKHKESQKIIDQFLYEKIISKRKMPNQNSSTNLDFHLLSALMDEEGGEGQIDDKFVRDTAINILAAGKNTVSAGLTWFFWLVATHPSVEAKILEEIRENLPENEDNLMGLGVDELSKLVYLHAALCETLRLYPPVPFQHKCAFKSDKLPSGHCVDSNTIVLYSLYSMGRMKETWGEDCLKFRPERWISNGGGIVHIPSYKFIAFNAGPRSCLGKQITFIQMKMVAAAILWNYHMHVVEGHLVSPSVSIILRMKHGLKVRVTKRSI